jgi:hypothetical protein
VTPSTGLTDGQTVTVAGTDFTPSSASIVGSMCSAEVVERATTTSDRGGYLNDGCGSDSFLTPVPDSGGNFTVPMTVFVSQPNFTGGNPLECSAPDSCFALFIDYSASGAPVAVAALAFGPPTPQSKAECKNGGWRNLANQQGQPFRNQGLCVSFVVAHRH